MTTYLSTHYLRLLQPQWHSWLQEHRAHVLQWKAFSIWPFTERASWSLLYSCGKSNDLLYSGWRVAFFVSKPSARWGAGSRLKFRSQAPPPPCAKRECNRPQMYLSGKLPYPRRTWRWGDNRTDRKRMQKTQKGREETIPRLGPVHTYIKEKAAESGGERPGWTGILTM